MTHRSPRSPQRVARAGSEHLSAFTDVCVAGQVLRAGDLWLVALVIPDANGDDAAAAVVEVEDEQRVERAQAVDVCRVEPARRVGEAHLADSAGGVGKPAVQGTIGQGEVGGQVTEQVERQRQRRQQVGPQPLVVETLTRLDVCGAGSGSIQRGWGEEGRAGVGGHTRGAVGSPPASPRYRRASGQSVGCRSEAGSPRASAPGDIGPGDGTRTSPAGGGSDRRPPSRTRPRALPWSEVSSTPAYGPGRHCRMGSSAEAAVPVYRGLNTQNSLPSGSAMTTQLTSPWPMSIRVAPRATRRSTSDR